MAELEVIKNKDEIKESVVTDEQKKDVDTFVQSLETAKDERLSDAFKQGKEHKSYKEKVTEVFNEKGNVVLKSIQENVTSNLDTINRDDTQNEKAISINSALDAFTKDINEYSKKWDTTKFQNELTIIDDIKKSITDKKNEKEIDAKKKEKEAKKKEIVTNVLAQPRTSETADKFFEAGKKEDFEAVMEYFISNGIGNSTDLLTYSNTDNPTLKNQVENFVNGVKAYLWKDAKTIKIGKAGDTFWWNKEFWSKFPKGTLLILYDDTDVAKEGKEWGKEKYVTRGTDEYVQKIISEKAIPEIKDEKGIITGYDISAFKNVNRTSKENGIEAFNDNNGNFWSFKRFMEQKMKDDLDYFGNNMPQIIEQILDISTKQYLYEKDENGEYTYDENTNIYTKIKEGTQIETNTKKYKKTEITSGLEIMALKNGYANALTDFVVANPSIANSKTMENYCKHLTENRLDLLWKDMKTRDDNYDKLIKSWNETGFRKTLKPEEQKRLIALQATINNIKPPKSAAEALSQGLDQLIDTFGPMLFNVLKFFGIGKTTLLKRFKGMEKKINEIYKKEYGLSKDEIDAVTSLSEAIDADGKELEKWGKGLVLVTAEQIKSAFDGTKTTYIGKLIAKKDYYKHINVDILKTALETYNKNEDKQLNINDIITNEKDKKTDKEIITEIKKVDKDDVFRKLLEIILDTENTRSNIASANSEIQAPSEKVPGRNEHNMEIWANKDAERYQIRSLKDIARYLTASLYTTKDLAYTLTENGLHNQKILTIPDSGKTKTETKKKNIAFKKEREDFDTDGKLSEKWNKKTIDQVIDVANSPDNLQIIRGATTINIKKKNTGNVLTYVDENNDKERVKIFLWDQIKEISKTKTPEELAEENYEKNKSKFDEAYAKITTDAPKAYEWFDFTKFEYNEKTTKEQKKYQDDILIPLKEIFTTKDQYAIFIQKDFTKAEYLTHLKNMLILINWPEVPQKEKEAIDNLWIEWNIYAIKKDWDNLIITSEKWDKTKNGTITLSNVDNKLSAERKPEAQAQA